jgi:lipopolysaccharide biosynthesis glycosyltransferase
MSSFADRTMPAQQPIIIVSAANRLYAMPLAVMMTSVVCNAKSGRDIDFYIIESDIDAEMRKKVEASVLQNKAGSYQVGIHWITLDASMVRNLPGAGHVAHITPDTYAKVLAPDLLPATCHRAISLDSDLVVLADVADLFDALDDQHTLAAVSNVFFPFVSSPFLNTSIPVVFNYAELGIPATNRYLQAGVLVINVDLWRERKITSRIIEYLEAYGNKIYFHDQGGLNAILFDQWMRLDQRWNQTSTILQPEHWKSPAYSKSDWRKTRDDPFIVHYTGPDKPWNPGYKRPRASFFYRYFQKTVFKQDLEMSTLENTIGYRNYFWLWKTKNRLSSMLSGLKARKSDQQ